MTANLSRRDKTGDSPDTADEITRKASTVAGILEECLADRFPAGGLGQRDRIAWAHGWPSTKAMHDNLVALRELGDLPVTFSVAGVEPDPTWGPECGTPEGVTQHGLRGEPACKDCLRARSREWDTTVKERSRRQRRRKGIKPRATGTETHCKHGHEWTEENTYMRPDGCRACRTCRRIHERKYAAKKQKDRPCA